MSVDVISVTSRWDAAIYDGSNGTELVALLGGTVDSDDGSTLHYTVDEINYMVAAGEYVLWADYTGGGGSISPLGPVPVGLMATLYAPLPATLAVVTRTGTGDIAGKAVAGTQDVVVTLDAAMADQAFGPRCRVQLLGSPGLLGGHGITGWTVTDYDEVTVHLSSAAVSGAVTGGVRVSVDELA